MPTMAFVKPGLRVSALPTACGVWLAAEANAARPGLRRIITSARLGLFPRRCRRCPNVLGGRLTVAYSLRKWPHASLFRLRIGALRGRPRADRQAEQAGRKASRPTPRVVPAWLAAGARGPDHAGLSSHAEPACAFGSGWRTRGTCSPMPSSLPGSACRRRRRRIRRSRRASSARLPPVLLIRQRHGARGSPGTRGHVSPCPLRESLAKAGRRYSLDDGVWPRLFLLGLAGKS